MSVLLKHVKSERASKGHYLSKEKITDLSYYKKLEFIFSEGDLDMIALSNTIKLERAKRNHYLNRPYPVYYVHITMIIGKA